MRTTHMLFAAMATLLLPGASFAEDLTACQANCAAAKESRNMDCPSPYDVSDSGQERHQCIKDNETAYEDCIDHCPPPPRRSSSSVDQVSPSPATSY